MNLVMYAIPFFVVLMAAEYLYGHWRGRNTYRLADTINSLSLGTLSRLTGLVKLGLAGLVFELVRGRLGLTAFATDTWWVWLLAFVGYDFCYYWSHRMGHEWRLFWASHVAHHQSEEFNLSTALRQTSTGNTFVFYVPLYLLGFPVEMIVTVGALNLIYQFWVHTEHVPELGLLEWVLVTPSNHRVHHAKNPCYIDRNYGGVFIVWDRLFGTYQRELPEEPCRYGITHQLASWNPLWANVHVWLETARDTVRTRRLRDKIRLWFSSPAWRPDDLPPVQADWQSAKYDPTMLPGCGPVVFVQYWLVTGAGLTLLVLASDLPYPFVASALTLLIYSFYVLGSYLEGRAHAALAEYLRLALLAAFLAFWRDLLSAEITAALTAYAGMSLAANLWLTSLRPRLMRAATTAPTEPAA